MWNRQFDIALSGLKVYCYAKVTEPISCSRVQLFREKETYLFIK
jgi:hypothetical protein